MILYIIVDVVGVSTQKQSSCLVAHENSTLLYFTVMIKHYQERVVYFVKQIIFKQKKQNRQENTLQKKVSDSDPENATIT